MPIDVGQFTTDVTVADGDLPLSAAQLEKLVQLVAQRVEDRQRSQERNRAATAIRGHAATPLRAG